jgi:hypothetical protein
MSFHNMPPVNYFRQLKMFNDGVPHVVRFWSVIVMAIFYQFAAGVYLASLTQMVGELSCLSEDVTMGGYCTLIGLNLIFPIMFKWKFTLYTRQLFFISSVAIILCSIASMFVTTPWVFWIICLVAGYFKMMGMFGCMSTIQLNITPTRNFAVFFPVIYVLVCGSIQLSGLVTAYVSYFYSWRVMNLVVMFMMLILDFWVYFYMKHDHRAGPPDTLKGIDWIGHLLWIIVSVIGTWIFTFGEHYDWWESKEIWSATGLFFFFLAVTIVHSKRLEHPFISLHAFGYSATYRLAIVVFGITVLSGGAHVLQPTYLSAILHYDALNIISLNYPELVGVIMGAILAYFVLVRWNWSVKAYLFLAFGMMTYYLLSMYYMCDTETDKETMYLAFFALGVSEVMMESIATYYLSQSIPWPHFFMNISIIGFIRCGVGSAAGAAIVHRFFNWSMTKSFMIASESITDYAGIEEKSQILETQSLLMALKESFGFLVMLGLLLMVAILLSNYRTTFKRFVPRMVAIRKWMGKPQSGDPTIPVPAK